jgi:hypothetical protein
MIKIIKQNKIICLSIATTLFFLFYLNIANITYPNDGSFYYYLSEQISSNWNIKIIKSEKINQTIIITGQLGIVFLLSILKNFFYSYNLLSLQILIIILWIYVYHYLKENAVIFKVNHKRIFILFFFILFQFENLRTATSFYNESIYYPFFIINIIIFFKTYLYQKKLSNTDILFITLYYSFGIIFQLQHLIICLAFLLFILIFYNKMILKKYLPILFYIIALTIISLIIHKFLFYKFQNISISQNFSYSYFNVIYFFQKLLNIFISPLNLHLFFHEMSRPQTNFFSNFTFNFYIYIIYFLIFTFFLYNLYYSKINYKIKYFTLIFIFLSFAGKLFISDYDIRYNIYSNFIISIIYMYFIENLFKKKFYKFFIFIIFFILLFFAKSINYIYNYDNRNVFETFSKIKKLNFKDSINTIDYIISDADSRNLYWIFRKQVCPLNAIDACPVQKKFIVIVEKNKSDFILNKNLDRSVIFFY